MDNFTNYAEIQAEKAEKLSFCKGIKLLYIKEQVKYILDLIGKNQIFEEYTIHNIDHIDKMLKIIEWLIPDTTKEKMSSAEWLMLTLAIYFHDLGMVVTREEFKNRDKTNFKEYKKNILNNIQNSEYDECVKNQGEKFLYQEFVRENHAIRIRKWIEGKKDFDLGEAKDICKEIDEMLKNLDTMFKIDLAMICESHHKDDIDDFGKYKVKKMYGNTDDERVNLNYIAIILRIADLLHITKDRTPSISRRLINISNPVSVIEWEKQTAVRAVYPKDQRNEDGAIDNSIPKDTIEITAYFDGAETADAYFGLSSYLQYTRKELSKCFEIIEKSQKREGATYYQFPWKEIDESQIEVNGFEKKKLQFTIAQENILQLLVGHTLYNDSSVVVRELVQNGIDAVRLQKQYEIIDRNSHPVKGKVWVEWDSKKSELSFWDNGTGMSIQDVENYLLKVGASKYRDDTIKKRFPDFSSISHFGIGILTCFMIANDIDIITNSTEQEEANIINLRKVNGSYLLRKLNKKDLDERIKSHGTMVKLHVRNDVDMTKIEDDLKKWIVVPEIPVYLKINGAEEIRIGYDSLSEMLTKHLNDKGFDVDGKKYDVYEKTHGNVTVAYAVMHQKYMSDWCLMRSNFIRMQKKSLLPIGTCVEGIRVEFSTPGYKNTSILAIANIKNSKYQTNVARSALELDANNEILSDIYDIYKEYIQEQMDKLEGLDYAHSWAISEGKYLMTPLISNQNNDRIEPMDEDVLIRRLAHLKCLILENKGERKVVSAEEVSDLEEINIFESEMTRAAEHLLKEVKTTATLSDIINAVCDNKFLNDVKNVICNIDIRNLLHQYALRNKEVCKINVAYKERRIQSTYTSKKDLWYKFVIRDRNAFNKQIYIPKKDFNILGLKEEVGVKTFDGIYIKSGTQLCDYLLNIIKIFQSENTEENKILLEVFLSYIFHSDILEVAYKKDINPNTVLKNLLGERFLSINEELINKIWAQIDSQEFMNKVLKQNYTLYSIDHWSRKNNAIL